MSIKMNRRTLLAGTAAAAGMAGVGLPAFAQGRAVNVIDGYPARAMWVQELSNFYLPLVNQMLDERGLEPMNFQESYGGSIVRPRGVLEGVRLGLGDIGVVTTIFHSSTLPSQGLSAVTPFISSDAGLVARSVDEIAIEFDAMRQEFEAQDQVYLATGVVLNSYQMFANRPIASLEDMANMRFAAAGYNLRYLEGLDGAVGVRGGLTDFYNMVQTNVTDGCMIWPEASITYAIAEVAPYMLRADLGAVNTKTLTVNRSFWNSLDSGTQEVLREAGIAYRDRLAEVAMGRAAASEAAFIEAGGTIVDLAQEERQAWAAAMPNIAAEWAAGLDADGKDGTGMLSAYIDKLVAGGATPARNWAVEA